jgi:hypothetical protein
MLRRGLQSQSRQIRAATEGSSAPLSKLVGQAGQGLMRAVAQRIEEFFEHMRLLAKAGPPDLEKMKELADRYEIEFLSHQR